MIILLHAHLASSIQIDHELKAQKIDPFQKYCDALKTFQKSAGSERTTHISHCQLKSVAVTVREANKRGTKERQIPFPR